MRIPLIIVVYGFCVNTLLAQNVKVNLDYSNIELTLQALNSRSTKDIDSLLALESTTLLIHQAHKFDENATKETFRSEFISALDGNETDKNTFLLDFAVKRKNSIETLYKYVKDNSDKIKESISAMVTSVTSKEMEIDVYFVAGGTSDGFSDGKSFTIDLAHYGSDTTGMKILLIHEVFHIVYEKINKGHLQLKSKLNREELDAFQLVEETLNEGMASYISDPLNVDGKGGYILFLKEKYERNIERVDESFQLLEIFLSHFLISKLGSFDSIYNIGFSAKWDSPFYFVGYTICKLLERNEGQGFLKKYIGDNPLHVLEVYNKYANSESVDAGYPKLGQNTLELLKIINEKID